MKKLLVLTCSIFLLGITSCQKDDISNESNSSTTSDRERITALVNKYKLNHHTNTPNSMKIDGLMGPRMSTALVGGLSGGAAERMMKVDGLMGPRMTSEIERMGVTVGGIGVSIASQLNEGGYEACNDCYVPQRNDTWDVCGHWYKDFCNTILANRDEYYSNGRVNYTELTNTLKSLFVEQYNAMYSTEFTEDDIWITSDQIAAHYSNWQTYVEAGNTGVLIADDELQFVMDSFIEGISELETISDVVAFTEEFQEVIASSSYPYSQIEIINQSLSLAKNSAVYWRPVND